jgi:hypothetical protein
MINSESRPSVHVDLELSQAEEDELITYAQHGIHGDRNALLSWGINQVLKNACGEMFVARKLGVRIEDIEERSEEESDELDPVYNDFV